MIHLNKFVIIENFQDLNANHITGADIAHNLSMQCRFNGIIENFYSVAEHSCILASMFEGSIELQRVALIHDAHEAYVGDLVRPVQQYFEDLNFSELTGAIDRRIFKKFKIENSAKNHKVEVKEMDSLLLQIERLKFFPRIATSHITCYSAIKETVDRVLEQIKCLEHKEAEAQFNEFFNTLF